MTVISSVEHGSDMRASQRKRWVGILIVSAISIFSLGGPAASENLHILADYQAYPKNWKGVDGKPHGIMIDILKEVTKRTGTSFTYTMVPWKTAFEKSKNGEGAIIGLSKTMERLKIWDYSSVMYSDPLVLVTWKDRPFAFAGLNSLQGKKIGVKLGASYGDDFNAAVQSGLFQTVQTHDRVGQLKMLARGRLDAVLVSPGAFALEPLFNEDEDLAGMRDEYVVVDPPLKLDPNFLGIPKSMGKTYLLQKINQALEEIREDQTYARIIAENTNKAKKELWFGN